MKSQLRSVLLMVWAACAACAALAQSSAQPAGPAPATAAAPAAGAIAQVTGKVTLVRADSGAIGQDASEVVVWLVPVGGTKLVLPEHPGAYRMLQQRTASRCLFPLPPQRQAEAVRFVLREA